MKIQYLCPLIQVFDMNTSLRFYCEVLEFKIHESAGANGNLDWVWLKWGDTNLMLNTAYETPYRPEQPDPAHVRAHDDTILYLGCPDVDGAYQVLRSKGLKIDPPKVAPYGMKQLHFHDPDGYGVCFQWPHVSPS
jgi:glyoxylase I family protein